MRASRISLTTAGLLALFAGVTQLSDVHASPLPKQIICHFSSTGPHLISISGNAVTSHFQNHGDTFPLDAFFDADGDGFGTGDTLVVCAIGDGQAAVAGDCNDADPTINPGAEEIAGDGIDQDCDGADLETAPS
jgi:hypothetical protein